MELSLLKLNFKLQLNISNRVKHYFITELFKIKIYSLNDMLKQT